MNIVIIGVGGIGAFYVARLQEAGHRVTAVARGDHLAALRSGPLRVDHPEHPFDGEVDACNLDALVQRDPHAIDLVVLLTKSMATATVATQLTAWLGEAATPVLSLQNGVGNEEILVAALGAGRVMGGYSVRLGGFIVEPGRVQCVGACDTWLGAWPRSRDADAGLCERVAEVAAVFSAAGLNALVSDDISREMWRKLTLNAALNPISALLRWDSGRLTRDPEVAPLIRSMMSETVRTARALGIDIGETDAEQMFALIHDHPPIKTSMLTDLERGRELELDAIAGAVIDRAREAGVDTPTLATVTALLKARLADVRATAAPGARVAAQDGVPR